MKDVRKNATVNHVARISPKKVYSGVKSKVAGNIKTINKVNKGIRSFYADAYTADDSIAENSYVWGKMK